MATVVVSSVIANKPLNGRNAWAVLSWVLGLKKLGFRVYFVEQISRDSCVDATGATTAFGHSVNLAYFKQATEQFSLAGSAALIYESGEQIHGLSYADLLGIAETADLLVNISGHLTLEPLMRRLRRKAYVDIDPGFTQFWHAVGNPGPHLSGHDFYFTIGENIGAPGCSIPTGGIRWRRTQQPVVLEYWPVTSESDADRFTTVANWRGPYGPIQHGDATFGLKVHEFRKFIELPERVQQTLEIALNIHPDDEKDLDSLRRHGWRIVDPRVVASNPVSFRHYVQTS